MELAAAASILLNVESSRNIRSSRCGEFRNAGIINYLDPLAIFLSCAPPQFICKQETER